MWQRVAIAIASYRSESQVLRLLESILSSQRRPRKVLIVDSCGTARLAKALADFPRETVSYENHKENLGSAGNLRRRLEWSASLENIDYVYALNHDAVYDPHVLERLLCFASEQPRLGAVYPLKSYTNRAGQFELSGTSLLRVGFHGRTRMPTSRAIPVEWNSSNGALYSLTPVRNHGALPRDDLWMGWEDLGYGRSLRALGYTQHISTQAIVADGYEYSVASFLFFRTYITDKPSWYEYYSARNVLLLARNDLELFPFAVSRVIMNSLAIGFLKPRKRERARLLIHGLLDALRGRTGKYRVP